MDYPGFGLSEGLHGYIANLDIIVEDVIEHYSKVKGIYDNDSSFVKKINLLFSCFEIENPNLEKLPSFLFGQSMGGAVALKVHLKQPHAWNGAVLVAPMCKVLN